MIKKEHQGRVAIVTAASRGIGYAVAKKLLAAGASVAICSRDKESLGTSAVRLSDFGEVFSMAGDIGSAEFLETFYKKTAEYFGKEIGILVNNSGGPRSAPCLELADQDWMEALNRNLMSIIRLSGLVIPGMKKNRWGRIINLLSLTAKEPGLGMGLSNVARSGAVAYGKTIAHEIGVFGITVNSVLTGGVLTDRFHSLFKTRAEREEKPIEELIQVAQKAVPVGKFASPEEFADAVFFLTQEAAWYINGVALPIDGGVCKSAL